MNPSCDWMQLRRLPTDLPNYLPEYGRNAGAVINMVTRGGTNAIYGTSFDYFPPTRVMGRP